jgi:hypothetical protein
MNGEGALAGAPDDLLRSVARSSEASHEVVAEYRGGPIATARLLIDCYVRPDPAWKTIEPSRPDNESPPSVEPAKDTGGGA